jgi:type III pantothenate kinase
LQSITIDLGNTFAKLARFEGNELVSFEKGIKIEEIASKIEDKTIRLGISSVTQPLEVLEELFKNFKRKLIINPQTPLPIGKHYDTPHTLGNDRLAAAVGASALFPNQNVVIVDMGTAIKYDYVSAEGFFEGGIISPGMRIRFEALHTFTKRLPLVEATQIPPLVGKSTVGCIESGVVNGIIHEAVGIINSYAQKATCQVILCGGDAGFFEMSLKNANFVPPITRVDALVMIGLHRILSFNLA